MSYMEKSWEGLSMAIDNLRKDIKQGFKEVHDLIDNKYVSKSDLTIVINEINSTNKELSSRLYSVESKISSHVKEDKAKQKDSSGWWRNLATAIVTALSIAIILYIIRNSIQI